MVLCLFSSQPVDELLPQLSVGDMQAVYLLAEVVALLLQLLAQAGLLE
jgi:hypothetical protein